MTAMAAVGRGPRFVRRHRATALASLGGGLLLGLVGWQFERWFTPSPTYRLERKIGRLEIRAYPDQIVAETRVEGADFEHALSEGFRRLAGYIFGGNSIYESVHLPVRSEQIAMRSPVTAERGLRGATVVRFFMPPERTLLDLPIPDDPRVTVRTLQRRQVAVMRFHGRYTEENQANHEEELLSAVRAAGLSPRGPVGFAGYDPPSTLPALRRVEAWVEVFVPT